MKIQTLSRTGSRRLASAVAISTIAAVLISGCATDTPSEPGEEPTDITIAMLPKALSIPYFDVSSAGAETAAEELGITLTVIGPSEPTAAAQLPFINTAVQQQVDGITVAATDSQALAPSLRQAMESGLNVTTFDSDVETDARTIFVNQVDPDEFALAMLESVGEQMNYEGQLALLSGLPTAQNQNDWIAVMEAELATPKWANVELVTIAYSDSVDQKSVEVFNGLLQTYPDLAGVVALDAVALPAAARTLQQSDRELALGGGALPNSMKEYIEDGTVQDFVLWDVEKLGYLSIYATYALIVGDIEGQPGETFEAGSLGEFTVGEGGEIILGPPTIFNADNIAGFNF